MTQAPLEPAFGSYAPKPLLRRLISLTRKQKTHWLGRRFAFLLRRIALMMGQDPYDVDVLGLKMRLYPSANVCEKRMLFTPQLFDRKERLYLATALPDDCVFVDIGANVGGHTLFLAAQHNTKQSQFYALEPQPDIFERLKFNCALNNLTHVNALPLAISDRDGEICLFLDKTNQGEASMKHVGYGERGGETFTTQALSLLSFTEHYNIKRIDGMKIDVEGAEDIILFPFFQQAPPSLYPDVLMIENSQGSWQKDVFALLEVRGYRAELVTKLNTIFRLQ
jgi:FkbM family methyltransferase